MDTCFLGIIDKFPNALKRRAKTRGTYDGTTGDELFSGPSVMNPGLTCTPWMFWQITSVLDDRPFVDLATGGALVVLSSTLRDHLADQQVSDIRETETLQSLLHDRGAALLRSALGTRAEFWEEADRLLDEHARGLAQEIECRREPALLTPSRFIEFVSAKFAPIALTMLAFTVATGQSKYSVPIERSIKHLAIASQLLDDLGDWREDVRAQRLTYFVKSLAPNEDWTAEEWPSIRDLQGNIDEEWAEIDLLNSVKEWLRRSVDAVAGIDCPAWISYLNGFSDLADQHLRGRTARHLARSIGGVMPDAPDR